MLYCLKKAPSHARKLVVAAAEEPGPDNVCLDRQRFPRAMRSTASCISVLAWFAEAGLGWGPRRRSNGPAGAGALGEEALRDEVAVLDAGAPPRSGPAGVEALGNPNRGDRRGDRDRATETLRDEVAVQDAGAPPRPGRSRRCDAARDALGDASLGDESLGDEPLGDAALGDEALGDAADAALGDESLGAVVCKLNASAWSRSHLSSLLDAALSAALPCVACDAAAGDAAASAACGACDAANGNAAARGRGAACVACRPKMAASRGFDCHFGSGMVLAAVLTLESRLNNKRLKALYKIESYIMCNDLQLQQQLRLA